MFKKTIIITASTAFIVSAVLIANYFIIAWQEPTVAPPAGGPTLMSGKWSDGDNPPEIHYSDGYVGIGTTDPAGRLHIGGTDQRMYLGTGGWFVINRGAGAAQDIYFGENTDTGEYIFRSSGDLTIEGNVGIGTTNPGSKFSIGTLGTIIEPTYNTVDQAQMQMYDVVADNSKRYFDIVSIGAQNGAAGGGVIRLITNPIDSNNGVERMRIERNGNVGIGLPNPSTKLEVDGTIQATAGNDICISGGNCLSTAGGGGLEIGVVTANNVDDGNTMCANAGYSFCTGVLDLATVRYYNTSNNTCPSAGLQMEDRFRDITFDPTNCTTVYPSSWTGGCTIDLSGVEPHSGDYQYSRNYRYICTR